MMIIAGFCTASVDSYKKWFGQLPFKSIINIFFEMKNTVGERLIYWRILNQKISSIYIFCSVLEIKYCWFFADHLRTKEEVKFTTDVAVISQQLSFSISKSFCKIVLNNERSKKRLLSNIISTQWITTDGRKVKLTWNKQPAAILDISETTKYYNLLQTFTFTLDLWKREPVRGQLPQGDSNLIAFIYKVYSPGTVSFLAWDKGQW